MTPETPPEPTDEDPAKEIAGKINDQLKQLDEIEADLKKLNPSGVEH